MKVKAFLKVSLKLTIKSFPTYIFIYVVFPMLLSLLLGYFQQDIFNPPVKIDKVNVNVVDRDTSQFSKGLIKYLNLPQNRKIIRIKKEKEKIKLILPKGYGKSLLASRKTNVIIKIKDSEKQRSAQILKQIVDYYNSARTEEIRINKNIDALKISTSDKSGLAKEIENKLNKAYTIKSVNNKFIKVKKKLNSYETYSVTFSGFMFLLLALSMAGGIFLEKENGMFRRILQTSISKRQYLNYSLASSLMFALIVNLIYVGAFKIIGKSFDADFMLLFLVIICQSILTTAVSAVLVAFFDKRSSGLIMNLLIVAQVLMGGMLFPLKGSLGNIVEILEKFSPDALISKAYKNLMIYNSFDSIKFYVSAMIVVSLVMYLISIIKVNIKWGEER